jgi:hypothetical protein
MEFTERCTSTFEDDSPASGGARNESNGSESNYWGVVCKTCKGLVAFDVAPFASFGLQAFSMQPGAICCGQGHTHIYFPRDFGFSCSVVSIRDAVMRGNRDVYRTINVSGHTSHDAAPKPPAAAAEKPAPGAPVRGPELAKKPVKPPPESLAADPRRAAAQAAAKSRWTKWAGLKMR